MTADLISNAIDWFRLEQRWENIGIAQSAGTTFTVQSSSGAAFSTRNAGYITLQSLANPGQLKLYRITANQSFTQAQVGNTLFGLTSTGSGGAATVVDIPFYLYAASNANAGENTVSFFICRVPHRTTAPVAGLIGQSGNTLASTQNGFFSLAAITASDYASAPCICIGSFRMRYATALWTIQSLVVSDGVGQFNDSTAFVVPLGQFGAIANSYYSGATAPLTVGGLNNFAYYVSRSGFLQYKIVTIPSTNGTTGANLSLAMPYNLDGSITFHGYYLAGGNTSVLMGLLTNNNTNLINQIAYTGDGSQGVISNANMSTTISSFSGEGYTYISLSA
jgi:hypothetical protein